MLVTNTLKMIFKRVVVGLMLGIGVSLSSVGISAEQGHNPHQAVMVASTSEPSESPATAVLDLGAMSSIDALVETLSSHQLVYVGETHDRYDHHRNQLAIIRGLHKHHPDLVIGMEFFQQPYQIYLDQYIGGDIDETAFLRGTEYFKRWGYDYRLYQPILRFAREQGIRLIALNIPKEITRKISTGGISSLSDIEKTQIPDTLDRSNQTYMTRLKMVFGMHPPREGHTLDRFVETQLVWDEGMAERAAAYFHKQPKGHMVLLAGSGHLIYGQGIPDRLERRVSLKSAIVINGLYSGVDRDVGDYLLLSEEQKLKPTGLMGVLLDSSEGKVRVESFTEDSPAKAAGMKKDDQITHVAGKPMTSYNDIRIALLNHSAGDLIDVRVLRESLFRSDKNMQFEIKLH